MERTIQVMVVENSETQAFRVRLLLEPEGYQVSIAATAEAALGELNRSLPDLIVVDYYLPGMRGDDLWRRVRMNLNTRGIPILVLTSEGADAEMQGLDSCADDYVSKSENTDILLLRIRALLGKARAQASILNPRDSDFRRARILAIDGRGTDLAFVSAELEGQGDEVETATSGTEGLDRLVGRNFDCVLVDLVMPEMDGIEVCRRINAMRHTFERPLAVIITTA